ncbi:uncharacterized protein LOC129589911 [Paramacrobiotus metropolitanus]|uniref:uncharacterized protein LOC129589911 n=1 Tax=Paramacrobiotus metropolitanus TaxID=2943436 RepID=UPI002445640E|nr:uncharacterized protein LOC129589911 [Paramacrobiotus metropolitanus]
MASLKEPAPPLGRSDSQQQQYGQNPYAYANNQRPCDHFRYHDHGPGLYGLTVEEIKTIQECRTDANWKYAMPSAAVAGLATHLAVKGGYLRSNPRFGSFFKVTAAALLGNVLGRYLYTRFGGCQEKLAKLNTPIGETARKLNEAGVRLPPYMIVAGAETHPWARNPWESWRGDTRGYGAGYRYFPGQADQFGPQPTGETAAEDAAKGPKNKF